MQKKAKDFSGASAGKIKSLSETSKRSGRGTGFAHSNLLEPVPRFITMPSEVINKNDNNSWIVMGRDRPSDRLSGYGGRGDTQAACIDLVAGRMGHRVREVDKNNQPVYVDNNFQLDAARIYISQKTDIDDNFALPDGIVGNSKTRSAIGIKADSIRVMSREGIKLVTKVDGENSQGGDVLSVYGIDLIAGADDSDMQPIPKGDNLTEALERIMENIKNLTGIVETFITSQMKFNQSVMSHTHVGNLAAPTSPSFELIPTGIVTSIQQILQDVSQLPVHRTNIEMFKMNYLKPIGKKYINSRHNNTN